MGAEWGFGSFGFADFGIASVGTINGVDADFGRVCISGPCARGKPNGVDYSIVANNFSLSNAGFRNANSQPDPTGRGRFECWSTRPGLNRRPPR
jgi:hypothetical protein